MKHQNAQTACGACCTQFRNLSVQLEGMPVLEDISLHLHCGEMTAVIGPNGAGKTTLFKAILHQVPYRGEIAFSDSSGMRTGTPRIGYVPQNLSLEALAPVSVLDFLGAALMRRPAFLPPTRQKRMRVQEALHKTGASLLTDRRIGALSGGELQRVLLALALTPVPDLLLLDEPVSGIDNEGLAAFFTLLDSIRSEYDISILLISHDFPSVCKHADNVILLNHRVLAYGSPAEVMRTEAFASLFPGYMANEVIA